MSNIFSQNLDFYNQSHAIIIGINNYISESITDLNYAQQDAESIANLLVNSLGYEEHNIHLLINNDATQTNIKNKLYEVAMSASEDDRILVFYGGHGETINLPTGGEIGYLLPVDADRNNLYSSGISMQEFKQISEITAAKHVLYLVDVCYGGIMTVGTRGLSKDQFNNDEKYLKKITSESARQIITAGGKDDKAQERAIWGHSAFTKELLSGIEDGLADIDQDGYITSDELGTYLAKKVYIASEENQTPIKGRYGSGEGEFVFINPAYIEKIVDDKINNVLNKDEKSTNINYEKVMAQALSENNNTIRALQNLVLSNNTEITSKISSFDFTEKYLDSSFVGPKWVNIFRENNIEQNSDVYTVGKYMWPYYDINSYRLALRPTAGKMWTHNRVSGLSIGGPNFSITQLKPKTIKLNYYSAYSFALEKYFHYISFKRHPWGKQNQQINIQYHDNISSNDFSFRSDLNFSSSLFFGKDYRDYYHQKGYLLDYIYQFSDKMLLISQFENTSQKYLPSIKQYKNNLFKKADIENRNNFHTAPSDFIDGKYVSIHTAFSLNNMKNNLKKDFSYTLEITDSIKENLLNNIPEIYLISESYGWNQTSYKMELQNAEDIINNIDAELGFIKVNFTTSAKDAGIANDQHIYDSLSVSYNDSIYTIQHHYNVTIDLPPGNHAYRFLIDSVTYDIDDNNETKTLNIDGKLKSVSMVNVSNPYRFDIGYEYSNKNIGSDFSFERLTFNYSTLRTISSKDALLFSIFGGWSKNAPPIQKLFYAGGERTVRGFSYLDTKKYSGKQMLVSKIEYHFTNSYNTFIFYDLATIGNKFNFDKLITSYGIGIYENILNIISDGGPDENMTLILYKTSHSNEGNWGIEVMFQYYTDQLDVSTDILKYILP